MERTNLINLQRNVCNAGECIHYYKFIKVRYCFYLDLLMKQQEGLSPIIAGNARGNQLEQPFFLPKSLNEILMFQLLQFQKLVNIQLLQNQNFIHSYLLCKKDDGVGKSTQSGTSSTSDGVDNINKIHADHRTVISLKSKAIRTKSPSFTSNQYLQIKRNTNNRPTFSRQSEDQDPSYDPNRQKTKTRLNCNSESKNVPKNISKAILIFVMKKQNSIKQVLEELEIDKEQFMETVSNLKGKINAISQLRSLWLDSQNKHAKIFRIISNYYLRKHSLSHIFNSRVVEHGKHLKYRQRILRALRNPQLFTHMKDY